MGSTSRSEGGFWVVAVMVVVVMGWVAFGILGGALWICEGA